MSEADHRRVSAGSIGAKIGQLTAAFGPVRHNDLLEFLEEHGAHLTPRQWEELSMGLGPDVDGRLLGALADYFTVPVAYLDGSDPAVAERVEAQLDLLAAMREAHVRSVGAAEPGDLTPEVMRSIAARLRQQDLSTGRGRKDPDLDE